MAQAELPVATRSAAPAVRVHQRQPDQPLRRLLARRAVSLPPEGQRPLRVRNCGGRASEQRAFPAAEPLIREAIDTARKACGEECGTLAEALVAMSTWYGDQGDEVSARHWFELSVEAQPSPRR